MHYSLIIQMCNSNQLYIIKRASLIIKSFASEQNVIL